MRIALFSDSYYPEINGVANSVYTLFHELTAMGHDVHVFAPRSKLPGAERNPNVHYLPSMPLLLLRDRNWGIYGPMLVRRLRRYHFDVIHTNSEFAVGYLGRLVAHARGCASVHTYHTVWEDYTYYVTHGHGDRPARTFVQKYSRFFCDHCDRVIVPTEKIDTLLRRYGVRSPISIVPSGMDLSRFEEARHAADIAACRAECGIAPDDRVLLNIGRIAKEKNLDQVMRVFARFCREERRARFVVVGEGPWVENLKAQAQALSCADRVTFTGPKPYAQIDRYYRMGEVFISASHSETQGLTYIEAMASGLCVVAYDDPCLKGVIEDGRNGLLAPDDDDAMLRAMRRAFSDEGRAIAARAPESVQCFSKAAFAKKVEQVYLDVLDHHEDRRLLRFRNLDVEERR